MALVKDYAMIETNFELFDREANEHNPSWRSSCEEHIVDMNVLLLKDRERVERKSSGTPLIIPLVNHTPATTGLGKVLLGKIHPFQL
jgi:hypothetical protein